MTRPGTAMAAWNSVAAVISASRQFIGKTVAILIHALAEAFFRLHAVVVIKGVDGELAERNRVADLVPRLKDETGRFVRGTGVQGLRR